MFSRAILILFVSLFLVALSGCMAVSKADRAEMTASFATLNRSVADSHSEKFSFDPESNQCRNSEGQAGLNIVMSMDEVSPCSQLSDTNLVGADLQSKDLEGSHFSDSHLDHANLSESNLSHSDFKNSSLIDANLKNSKLNGADFSGADLTGADLSGADLSDAILTDTMLDEAVLNGTILDGAHIENVGFFKTQIQDVTMREAVLDHVDFTQVIYGASTNWTKIQSEARSTKSSLFPSKSLANPDQEKSLPATVIPVTPGF